MDNYWENEVKYPVDASVNGEVKSPVYSQQFGASTGGSAPGGPPKERKHRYGLGIVALCLVLSLICGFGGSYLGNRVFSQQGGSSNSGFIEPGEHSTVTTSIDSLGDVVDATKDCVVEITTESMTTSSIFGQYITEGAGSGVIIRSDGYIVTNNHVTSGAKAIRVTMTNGKQYDATLVGADAKTDLAVLKIDESGLTPAVMGNSNDVKVGDTVIAIGNPLGSLGGTVTDGIISALDREIQVLGQMMTLLQTNAAVNPGNSGGGLFNAYGELVGIVNAKPASDTGGASSIEGLGFAIPVDTVKEVAGQLIDSGYVTGRVMMGVSVLEISDQATARQYNVDRFGVYIVSITDGLGADKAGLKVGDCILSINDNVVEQTADVTKVLDEVNVGDRVAVQIIRNGKLMNFNVELSEYVPEMA